MKKVVFEINLLDAGDAVKVKLQFWVVLFSLAISLAATDSGAGEKKMNALVEIELIDPTGGAGFVADINGGKLTLFPTFAPVRDAPIYALGADLDDAQLTSVGEVARGSRLVCIAQGYAVYQARAGDLFRVAFDQQTQSRNMACGAVLGPVDKDGCGSDRQMQRVILGGEPVATLCVGTLSVQGGGIAKSISQSSSQSSQTVLLSVKSLPWDNRVFVLYRIQGALYYGFWESEKEEIKLAPVLDGPWLKESLGLGAGAALPGIIASREGLVFVTGSGDLFVEKNDGLISSYSNIDPNSVNISIDGQTLLFSEIVKKGKANSGKGIPLRIKVYSIALGDI